MRATLDLLEKAYGRVKSRSDGSEGLIDQFVHLVLLDGTTPAKAARAVEDLKAAFTDWNELRVSKPYEVRDALVSIQDGREGGKADVLVFAFQKIFADKSKLNLEFLQKQDPAQRRKYLGALKGLPGWIQAVLLAVVEGPSSDQPDALRVARRIGCVDKKLSPAKARAKLAAACPGDALLEAIGLFVQHGDRICVPKSPDCPRCFLKASCKHGIANTTPAERESPAVDDLLAAAVKNRPPMVVPWERPKEFVLPKVSPPPQAKRKNAPPPLPKGPRGGPFYD